MFSILKRRKPLEIRFFTPRDGVAELFPPRMLNRAAPEWWKKAPTFVPSKPPMKSVIFQRPHFTSKKLNKSIKQCWAIQKTLELGIGLPLWQDMFLSVNQEGQIFPVQHDGVPNTKLGTQHPKDQYPRLLDDEWVNWKFYADWMAYTEEPVNFYMSHPFYHMAKRNWECMPGVMEFHWQHKMNVNTILRKPPKGKNHPATFEYEFTAGDILCYFIPMVNDRKIIIKAEQVTTREWEKLHYGQKMFSSSANVHRKNNWGGCPFPIRGEK